MPLTVWVLQDHPGSHYLEQLAHIHVLVVLGAPELNQCYTWGLMRAEKMGRIISLDLLATLLLMMSSWKSGNQLIC